MFKINDPKPPPPQTVRFGNLPVCGGGLFEFEGDLFVKIGVAGQEDIWALSLSGSRQGIADSFVAGCQVIPRKGKMSVDLEPLVPEDPVMFGGILDSELDAFRKMGRVHAIFLMRQRLGLGLGEANALTSLIGDYYDLPSVVGQPKPSELSDFLQRGGDRFDVLVAKTPAVFAPVPGKPGEFIGTGRNLEHAPGGGDGVFIASNAELVAKGDPAAVSPGDGETVESREALLNGLDRLDVEIEDDVGGRSASIDLSSALGEAGFLITDVRHSVGCGCRDCMATLRRSPISR